MRTDILEKKQDIINWIEEGQSKAFICKNLKCKPDTLSSYLKKMGIEYKGNQGGKGIKIASNYINAEDYAKKDNVVSHKLRLKLIRDGIKEEKCEYCGLSEWRGKKVPLELHHVDGNHFNNELSNLVIICPNCHALEDGNSGSNKGRYTK